MRFSFLHGPTFLWSLKRGGGGLRTYSVGNKRVCSTEMLGGKKSMVESETNEVLSAS